MLGKQLEPEIRKHPGKSAFLPLASGIDALAARLGLTLWAEQSLDVQYYIWRADTTGVALVYALLQAAERGVRVRVLLDDLQASEYDPALLALDQHPKIEVRMFNPSAMRKLKMFEMLSRFAQLNRRMHNKSFIADNQMAIVGGRNIGDEYYNASQEVDFSDFDVLTYGPVVPEISSTFDLYWNSELAVPISVLYDSNYVAEHQLEDIKQRLQAGWLNIQSSVYAQAVRESDFAKMIQQKQARIYWGKAQAVADAPSKLLNHPDDNTTHLGPQLIPVLENIQSEFLIISPYFVPGDRLTTYLADLVKRGVSVTVLTNSLASNDVGLVHAGYAKYRERLLEAGVNLYEYKANSPGTEKQKRKGSGIMGSSSRASLHAKVFVVDRKQTFVGSMNLDPRSFHLNSELGIIIDSEDLASAIVKEVQQGLADNAYRVHFKNDDEQGRVLRWETREDGQLETYSSEPHVGILRRMGIWFMSLFVAEELL